MNGHLRRSRCACFAKRKEGTIVSATDPRAALSGAPYRLRLRRSFDVGGPNSLRFSLRLAAGAFLDGLNNPDLRIDP